ncbi:hypothetical protein GCM10023321_14460 [Pseudonocardia eucalypti]|uniref:Uncharacterized protein n=1 Tax=Pseudonocardia eucalypti TaxID=648755 RepID=A0ABP9PPC1_9PSEU
MTQSPRISAYVHQRLPLFYRDQNGTRPLVCQAAGDIGEIIRPGRRDQLALAARRPLSRCSPGLLDLVKLAQQPGRMLFTCPSRRRPPAAAPMRAEWLFDGATYPDQGNPVRIMHAP